MTIGSCARGASALALLFGVSGSAFSQPGQRPSAPDDKPPFRAIATAVVADVVVRDAKGAPVLDLKPDDFELFEDDVRQTIGQVTLATPGVHVERGSKRPDVRPSPTAASPADATAAGISDQSPTVVAMVFHRMSPEARGLSYEAALQYLESPARAHDFAGVFLIDQTLETLHTYTNDREAIRAALRKAAARASTGYSRAIPAAGGTADRDPRLSPTASAESPGRPAGEPGYLPIPLRNRGDTASWKLEQMRMRMEEEFMVMARDQQGLATTDGLIALVGSLGELPGRKTVVFLAEGLSIPPAAQARFEHVIELANRHNVSLYTMDAAGLRVHSEQAATGRAIGSLAVAGLGRAMPGDNENVSPDSSEGNQKGAQTKQLEKNEFVLREDPRATLGRLATETGGFFIENTNDLAGAFRRIDADRRFHYLLTYSPTNAAQDSTFRRITVKVKRRNVDVRARTGYYAVRGLGTIPTLHFETAALAALDEQPRPSAIPIRAQALQFPDRRDPGRVAIIVSAPADHVAYYLDRDKTSYWTNFTILTRLMDDKGAVVRKGSQPYHLTGPAASLDRARAGDIVFYRQPSLPPGRYTLECVIHDALSTKAGAASMAIEVPALHDNPIGMSSLVLVRRMEPVPEPERDPRNPLYVGDRLVYPSTGDPLSKSRDRSLSFFYSVLAGNAPLRSRLELVTGGRAVANVPLTLPAPDADGRIQHLAQLPLGNLAEGDYDLRVTVDADGSSITRSAPFSVTP